MHYLADTQTLVWYLADAQRLTGAATAALQEAAASDDGIYVSAYSLVELAYVVEKARDPITVEQYDGIVEVLRWDESPFEVIGVDLDIAEHVRSVSREVNADPGDRIIVATAEVYDLAIVSSDRKLPRMTTQEVVW